MCNTSNTNTRKEEEERRRRRLRREFGQFQKEFQIRIVTDEKTTFGQRIYL
jgi:hypothetical protein